MTAPHLEPGDIVVRHAGGVEYRVVRIGESPKGGQVIVVKATDGHGPTRYLNPDGLLRVGPGALA